MSAFFITGTGTDIGKTLVMTSLCWQLKQAGKEITALKPVITGFDPEDTESDAALILAACELKITPALLKTISPWHFTAPLAPSMAAAREKKSITVADLVRFCHEHEALKSDVVLVEGAGGVMAPIDAKHTMLDWMVALQWQVILVTGSYLGAISHTLTAIEVLRAHKVKLVALVVNESNEMKVSLDDTAAILEKFMPAEVPVVKIPRLKSRKERWKQAPLIDWICR